MESKRMKLHLILFLILFLLGAAWTFAAISTASGQSTGPFATPGEAAITTFHAEGAQIYECKAASDGQRTWQFREPIAALMGDGKTIGRHYAGPSWEHVDGSTVTAKPVANAAGGTSNDIPWLKLEATAHRGSGLLADTATVLRINTRGGGLSGSCDEAGSYRSIPYAADYVFLRKRP
jgi:hypothetical protein